MNQPAKTINSNDLLILKFVLKCQILRREFPLQVPTCLQNLAAKNYLINENSCLVKILTVVIKDSLKVNNASNHFKAAEALSPEQSLF